jgi:BioD-like phosphotransacetylase family protein
MKSLYITSVERYSGKTAACLALGKRLKADGYKVGYLKPLSLQPWRVGSHIADEDAGFVKDVLELAAPSWELSPVVITPEFLREHLQDQSEIDLMDQVKAACESAGAGQDVLLLEGGASLREGYVVGLPTPAVADTLGSHVLVVVKYRDEIRLLDDALAAKARLGKTMRGIIINRVPPESVSFAINMAVPYLTKQGINVFGVLPEVRGLAALSVEELVQALKAEILTKYYRPQSLVENLTVGAMTADAALSRFRKYSHKAVITGGDRTDIQLAALETSTTCLVLTGNLHPSPLVVKQAEEFGVTVLLVRTNTMETVEKIEDIYGKTRLGQASKLQQFEDLISQHVNLEDLYRALGLK